MLDWLKHINKDFPEFWKTYLSKFDKKSKRYVILSTQYSGLNFSKDVIFSIGAFAVVDDSIFIGDSFEAILARFQVCTEVVINSSFVLWEFFWHNVEYSGRLFGDPPMRRDVVQLARLLSAERKRWRVGSTLGLHIEYLVGT